MSTPNGRPHSAELEQRMVARAVANALSECHSVFLGAPNAHMPKSKATITAIDQRFQEFDRALAKLRYGHSFKFDNLQSELALFATKLGGMRAFQKSNGEENGKERYSQLMQALERSNAAPNFWQWAEEHNGNHCGMKR